jgi:hypothetical protein
VGVRRVVEQVVAVEAEESHEAVEVKVQVKEKRIMMDHKTGVQMN